MENLSLRNRKKIIIDYLNEVPLEKIALELKISIDDVKNVLDEWKNGYVSMYTNELEIANELKEIARMIKDKEISIEDLIQGYTYFEIFKNLEHEKILKIVKELSTVDEKKKEEFYDTAEKMLKFSKYKNIDYVDIPDALEEMVQKGRELNSEIKEKELLTKKLGENIIKLNEELELLKSEIKAYEKEIDFAKELKKYMVDLKIEENRLRDFLETISSSEYNIERLNDIYDTVKGLRAKNMDAERFLKLSDYLLKLIEFGLPASFLKNLAQELEDQSISFNEYIEEIDDYIKDKVSYKKEIEELKKERKDLESQIRSMRSEIKEYFKKVKPKMQ